jgi:hypothetical protein
LSGNVPGGTTPSLFDLQIQFSSPFLYNGTEALVVEIRKYGSGELGRVIGAAEIPGTIFYTRSDRTETFGTFGPESQFNYQVVPEPSAIKLLGMGLLTLLALIRKHI